MFLKSCCLPLVENPCIFHKFPVFLSINYPKCQPRSITRFFSVWVVKHFFFIFRHFALHITTCSIVCFLLDTFPIMLLYSSMFPLLDMSNTDSIVLFIKFGIDFVKFLCIFSSGIAHDRCTCDILGISNIFDPGRNRTLYPTYCQHLTRHIAKNRPWSQSNLARHIANQSPDT